MAGVAGVARVEKLQPDKAPRGLSANSQPGLRTHSARPAIIVFVEDPTEEALQRIREELARRGLTLAAPARGPGERTAEGEPPERAQLRPAHEHEHEHELEHERLHTDVERPVSRSWLRYTLLGFGLLALLPWLAPVFAAAGWWGLADPIYTLYMLLCHQLPERAATLFGYQVAFCWRNAAIYGGMFGFGLLYAWSTRHRAGPSGSQPRREAGTGLLALLHGARLPKAIPLWVYVLTLVPMALDGLSHTFGLRDGLFYDPWFGSFLVGSQTLSLNWWLRVSTGLLAAFGSVWFTFPRLDKYIALTRITAGAYARNEQRSPSPLGRSRPLGFELAPARVSSTESESGETYE